MNVPSGSASIKPKRKSRTGVPLSKPRPSKRGPCERCGIDDGRSRVTYKVGEGNGEKSVLACLSEWVYVVYGDQRSCVLQRAISTLDKKASRGLSRQLTQALDRKDLS